VREDGRIVGEEWQEKVYEREEWKKPLRTARNGRILHMPMEENRICCLGWRDFKFITSLTALVIIWCNEASSM
jgi:hypothetical protein